MNQTDVLKYALDHDMIDLQRIQQQIEMDKRIAILKKHPYSILYSKTKRRWYTRFDTDNGVVQRTKNTRTELEALVVNFYENDGHFEEVVETYTFTTDGLRCSGSTVKKIIQSSDTRQIGDDSSLAQPSLGWTSSR